MLYAPSYRRHFDLSFGIWHKILTRLWKELSMSFHYILNPPRIDNRSVLFPGYTPITITCTEKNVKPWSQARNIFTR